LISIRNETGPDVAAVASVNRAAFGRPEEAALVDAIRGAPGAVSLVAVDGNTVVGHILFTPVTIEQMDAGMRAAGLAPMAVAPERQRQGIGSRLVVSGLDACRAAGYDLVVVLGHPEFYPKFGFVTAASAGLRCEYDVPSEAFMVAELRRGSLARAGGLVQYLPEFSEV
jgi:putative acetyltransferase